MHLAVSLFLGLLYVVSTRAPSTAESQHQFALLTTQLPLAPPRQTFPRLDEITIDQIHGLFNDGSLTSEDLAHIERTREVNGILHAVSEINPDALAIARSLDAERAAGSVRGQGEEFRSQSEDKGVRVKSMQDNIATRDQMNTTSGSYALLGATVSREATVVSKLRDAGAIVLGKATMGEWAQCRSRKASSSHGWSAYGGQTLGAYYPRQDPSGSSSGSAVAVSIGLALGSLATETSGSIVLPGERSNIVGIKPTLGLTSRSMVIPISLRQDTVGPMARTVKDAAYMLSVFAGKDKFDNWTSAQPFQEIPDYVKSCKATGLKDARLGIPRNGIDYYMEDSVRPIMAAFEEAVQTIIGAGASVSDNANFTVFDPPAFGRNSSIVLDTDFVAGLADYLTGLVKNPHKIHNLDDIARYTKSDPREEYPNRDTYVWDRELTRNITNESPESWEAYQANVLMAEEQGVLGVLDRYNLDALVMPTFASFHLPAIAGLPIVTVPLGFYPAGTRSTMNLKRTMVSVAPGVPFGIAFIGRRWSEETLISLAYAFEQRTQTRRKIRPLVSATYELGQDAYGRSIATEQQAGMYPSIQEVFPQPTVDATVDATVGRHPRVRKWTWPFHGFFSSLV